MRQALVILFTALMLTACGGPSGGRADYATEPMPAPSMKQSSQELRTRGYDADEEAPAPEPQSGAPSQQFIAYTHALGLSLPKASVEPMFNAHAEACRSAGPSVCLVTNSNLRKQDEDRVYGELYLRATEDWIAAFNAGLDGEVAAARGDITARTSTATNLTTQIIDTDARLQAQVTLRNRLLELLETRDGKLSDFLEIERELARVTGTINSIEANLKALKDRVALSSLHNQLSAENLLAGSVAIRAARRRVWRLLLQPLQRDRSCGHSLCGRPALDDPDRPDDLDLAAPHLAAHPAQEENRLERARIIVDRSATLIVGTLPDLAKTETLVKALRAGIGWQAVDLARDLAVAPGAVRERRFVERLADPLAARRRSHGNPVDIDEVLAIGLAPSEVGAVIGQRARLDQRQEAERATGTRPPQQNRRTDRSSASAPPADASLPTPGVEAWLISYSAGRSSSR